MGMPRGYGPFWSRSSCAGSVPSGPNRGGWTRTPLSPSSTGQQLAKGNLAGALEFLLAGRSSRCDLLGGAKAEYHGSLRNAHLPSDDQEAWVAAGLRGGDPRHRLSS